jgi:SNF2 family DNA or RNA helicase
MSSLSSDAEFVADLRRAAHDTESAVTQAISTFGREVLGALHQSPPKQPDEQHNGEGGSGSSLLHLPLLPHQEEGVRWLGSIFRQGINGILGDDMGLGKTYQALALLAYMHWFSVSSMFECFDIHLRCHTTDYSA